VADLLVVVIWLDRQNGQDETAGAVGCDDGDGDDAFMMDLDRPREAGVRYESANPFACRHVRQRPDAVRALMRVLLQERRSGRLRKAVPVIVGPFARMHKVDTLSVVSM